MPATTDKAPAWETKARERGLSDEDIADMRRDIQRDFTRARQKDASRLDTLEQQIQQMRGNGVQQAPAQSNKLPWDAVLEKYGMDKEAPKLKEMLQEYGTAIAQSVLAASQGMTNQAVAPLAQSAQQNWLQNERTQLAKRFGADRIEALWPDIEAEAKERAKRGETFKSVEDVFRESFPDEYGDAYFQAETERRRAQSETNKQKSSEGFITTRRENPIQIADSRPSTDATPDLEQIGQDAVAEALREMGLRT